MGRAAVVMLAGVVATVAAACADGTEGYVDRAAYDLVPDDERAAEAATATDEAHDLLHVRALGARELALQSDVVVMGEVVAATALPVGPSGEAGIHSRVHVDIDTEWKGPSLSGLDFHVAGGELEGRKRVLTGFANLVVGERALFFLRRSGSGELWLTSPVQGKWVIAGDRSTSPVALSPLGSVPALALRDASRVLAHPADKGATP